MSRINLSDEEWTRILANLKKLTGIRVGQPETCRQFISACLWILRSGAQWRVLPPTHALGMPVKFSLTGGQEAECRQAIPLLENVNASDVLADKAYDTNELREWLKSRGIKAVIPPKSNRKEEIECDYWHYKERHAIECMFGKLKHYRRIATRYEKKAINYMGMLSFSSALLWLR